MKQFFLNIAVPRISFLSAVVSSIFILSLTSSVYKSSSAIDVSSSGSDSFASSFTSSLISSSGSSDAFQIKLYLESHEASNILREKYEIENFFVKDDISFFF
jgi:capsule polysaccharide export protein KpsE/RkpR